MKLSIIIITKNEEKNILNCLNSIKKNLNSFDEREYEIIVVDSNSSDLTRSLVKKFQSSFGNLNLYNIIESNQYSASLSRQVGLEKAHGKFILFLDGDMELKENFIEKSLIYFEKANEKVIGIIGIRDDRIILKETLVKLVENVYNISVPSECLHFGGAVIFKRYELEKIGGYDKNIISSEEPELYIRIKKRGMKVYQIPENMINHNIQLNKKSVFFKKIFQKRSKGLGQTFRKTFKVHSIISLFKHKPLAIFFIPFSNIVITLCFIGLYFITYNNTFIAILLILNIVNLIFSIITNSIKHNLYVFFNFITILNGYLSYKKVTYTEEKIL